jgi:hypothetical protein
VKFFTKPIKGKTNVPFPPVPVPPPAPAPAPAPAPVPAPVAATALAVIAPPAPPVVTPSPSVYRYVLGPAFNAAPAPVVPPTPPAGKTDVSVALGAVDNVGWTVTVTLPAYSLTTSNQLMEVRAYLAPAGSTLPPDAASWVASANPVTVEDVSTVQSGGDDVIPLPAVPAGAYLGQILLGFAS